MKCKLRCQDDIKIRKEVGGNWREVQCPVCKKMSCVFIGEEEKVK